MGARLENVSPGVYISEGTGSGLDPHSLLRRSPAALLQTRTQLLGLAAAEASHLSPWPAATEGAGARRPRGAAVSLAGSRAGASASKFDSAAAGYPRCRAGRSREAALEFPDNRGIISTNILSTARPSP